jgi:hypothetical protein
MAPSPVRCCRAAEATAPAEEGKLIQTPRRAMSMILFAEERFGDISDWLERLLAMALYGWLAVGALTALAFLMVPRRTTVRLDQGFPMPIPPDDPLPTLRPHSTGIQADQTGLTKGAS